MYQAPFTCHTLQPGQRNQYLFHMDYIYVLCVYTCICVHVLYKYWSLLSHTEKPLQIFLGLCMCTHMLTERQNPWGILENKMLTPVGIPFSKMPHVIFSPWENKNKSLIFMLCNAPRPQGITRIGPASALPQIPVLPMALGDPTPNVVGTFNLQQPLARVKVTNTYSISYTGQYVFCCSQSKPKIHGVICRALHHTSHQIMWTQ